MTTEKWTEHEHTIVLNRLCDRLGRPCGELHMVDEWCAIVKLAALHEQLIAEARGLDEESAKWADHDEDVWDALNREFFFVPWGVLDEGREALEQVIAEAWGLA